MPRMTARPPARRGFRPATLLAMMLAAAPAAAQAPRADAPRGPWQCGTKTYCTQMTSCAEAQFHYRSCGLLRLDGDRDGVPCERLCGPSRPDPPRRR
jgi:hypothetical protein